MLHNSTIFARTQRAFLLENMLRYRKFSRIVQSGAGINMFGSFSTYAKVFHKSDEIFGSTNRVPIGRAAPILVTRLI